MSDGRDASWHDGRDRQRRQHPAVDHGHNVLRDQGYPDNNPSYGGYAAGGYDPNYDPNYGGYVPESYDANTYGDPGNGYGYPPQGYSDQDYRSGYDQPDYGHPGYGGQGYPPDAYPAQGYPGGGYGEQPPPDDGFFDSRYDPRYPPTGQGDYPTGSFIEHGFDSPAGLTTSGRMRAVGRGVDEGRTTGHNRRIPGVPVDVDFPSAGAKRKKKRRKKTPIVLIVMLLLLAGVGGGAYFGLDKIRSYFGSAPDYTGLGSGDVKVKIAEGDTATAIADTLLADHVIKSKESFIKAAIADPKSKTIEHGWYRLHEHMSAKNALAMLVAKDSNGNPLNLFIYKVTIPEGTISIDIYALLSKATGIPVQQFIDAAKDPVALGVDKAWFTAKRDDGRVTVTANVKGFKYPAMIEGFLFPATYSFQPDETAQQMLADMVKKFNDVATQLDFVNLVQSKLKIPPIEALIAASIAQSEATTAQDMAGVTRVLYNRVFKGLANKLLGVDSETNYFLRMTGHDAKTSDQLKSSELNDKNDPYNTHTVTGFPPGAISNPGEDALKAALNPDPSKVGYGYFQTIGNDPKVVFSKTYADFCKLNTSC
ncbi:MAG TPA: endolytic transglycosylase MltG [Micromonosporaceae bacterium]|nr:endolytic transglycosylase MltG [Micromonosporaceae bacterium]